MLHAATWRAFETQHAIPLESKDMFNNLSYIPVDNKTIYLGFLNFFFSTEKEVQNTDIIFRCQQ